MSAEPHLTAKATRQSLRLDAEILEAVDALRARRTGFVSRNTWITEAIREKLAREQDNFEKRTPGAKNVHVL